MLWRKRNGRDGEQWVEHSGVAAALKFVARVELSPGSLSYGAGVGCDVGMEVKSGVSLACQGWTGGQVGISRVAGGLRGWEPRSMNGKNQLLYWRLWTDSM